MQSHRHFKIAFLGISAICVLSCSKRESPIITAESRERTAPYHKEARNNHNELPDLRNPKDWLDDRGVPVRISITELVSYLNTKGEENWDLDGENGGYLLSLFTWCDPADFEKALNILAKARGDDSTKLHYLDLLVERILREGGESSFGRVTDGIRLAYGSGRQAALAYRVAFRSAGFSQSSLAEYRRIEYPDEKQHALRGLASSMQYAKSIDSVKSIEIQELSNDERSALLGALATRIANAKGIGRTLEDVLAETTSVVSDPKVATELLIECANRSPFEIWELAPAYEASLGEEAFHSIQRSSISAMAQKNGEIALGRVLSLTPGETRASLFQAGMRSFLDSNSQSASAWIHDNYSKLQPNDLDAIGTSVVEFSLKEGEFENARLWLGKVSDPNLREQLADQLESSLPADPHSN